MDYRAHFSDVLEYLKSKRVRQVLIVGLIISVGTGGYYINRYFANRRQQNAILAFNEAMQTYITALIADFDWVKKGDKAPWDEVELAYHTAYEQNSSAKFAPFFLIYEAQALAAGQKYAEAAKLVGDALALLSTSSPFYHLYAIMQAVLLIDAGNDAGVLQLKNLANDTQNSYSDMAQYYLAQYYLSQDQAGIAADLFKKLATQKSSWGDLAQDYIQNN